MPSKRKNCEPKTLPIYHRSGVNIIGIGFCGPNTAAKVSTELANDWIETRPKTWSKSPFAEVEQNGE